MEIPRGIPLCQGLPQRKRGHTADAWKQLPAVNPRKRLDFGRTYAIMSVDKISEHLAVYTDFRYTCL